MIFDSIKTLKGNISIKRVLKDTGLRVRFLKYHMVLFHVNMLNMFKSGLIYKHGKYRTHTITQQRKNLFH